MLFRSKFSVIVDNYIELEQHLSGSSISNGLNYGLSYIPNSNNEIFGFVRYVNEGSSADIANIQRGDIFRGVNGINLTIDKYSDLLSQEIYTLNFASYLNNNTDDSNSYPGQTFQMVSTEFSTWCRATLRRLSKACRSLSKA